MDQHNTENAAPAEKSVESVAQKVFEHQCPGIRQTVEDKQFYEALVRLVLDANRPVRGGKMFDDIPGRLRENAEWLRDDPLEDESELQAELECAAADLIERLAQSLDRVTSIVEELPIQYVPAAIALDIECEITEARAALAQAATQ